MTELQILMLMSIIDVKISTEIGKYVFRQDPTEANAQIKKSIDIFIDSFKH